MCGPQPWGLPELGRPQGALPVPSQSCPGPPVPSMRHKLDQMAFQPDDLQTHKQQTCLETVEHGDIDLHDSAVFPEGGQLVCFQAHPSAHFLQRQRNGGESVLGTPPKGPHLQPAQPDGPGTSRML